MRQIATLQRMNIGSGFRAFALCGGEMDAPIDPFLGIDHAWMSESTFQPHPHAGFSAVSYLFLDSETGINNRDSLGNQNSIQPGGLHWTAAGRGVVHDEVPVVSGQTVHLLQIFVNLAVGKQSTDAFALSLEPQDVPVVHLPGAKIRVPLGSFSDARSPLNPPTDVTLLDISLKDGAALSVPVAADDTSFVMPIFGTLEIDGQVFEASEPRLPVFEAQPTSSAIRLQTTQGSAKAVVFSGRPLNQPVLWQGPMALASAEALTERITAYRRGEFGSL